MSLEKPEFWERAFIEKHEMWGYQPSNSTVIACEFFKERGIKNVLVPGVGYGRNAQHFRENGMNVTGIEISKTAIDLAQKHYGSDLKIHHGSVTDMPFDDVMYDGIFCYGLIHLLDTNDRAKLIKDCFNQLSEGGYMFFTTISKEAPSYGKGIEVGKDRYVAKLDVTPPIYFHDEESNHAEFDEAGLFEITNAQEGQWPFYLLKCKKDKK